MKHQGIVLLVAGLLSLSSAAGFAAAQDAPTYMNADLVSADSARRVVVVRVKGETRSFLMDDLLAGAPGVKPGDHVILTLRGGSGVLRVSAITRTASSSPSYAVVIAKPQATAGAVAAQVSQADHASIRDAFARQVASLAEDARPIDVQWTNFVTDCKPQPVSASDGRAWFGLWDGRVRADYTPGNCREMFNQMIAAGEVIKQGMATAEESARKALTPGEMREIRKRHAMDWDGWTLPAPPKREP